MSNGRIYVVLPVVALDYDDLTPDQLNNLSGDVLLKDAFEKLKMLADAGIHSVQTTQDDDVMEELSDHVGAVS
jgi:hypothetical protein